MKNSAYPDHPVYVSKSWISSLKVFQLCMNKLCLLLRKFMLCYCTVLDIRMLLERCRDFVSYS